MPSVEELRYYDDVLQYEISKDFFFNLVDVMMI